MIVYVPGMVGEPVSVGFEPSYVPGEVTVLPIVPNTSPGGIGPLIVHDCGGAAVEGLDLRLNSTAAICEPWVTV